MAVEPPPFVEVVRAESAAEMFEAVKAAAQDADIVVKAAAVADYRPKTVAAEKMKKQDGALTLELERTTDILAWLGAHKKPGQTLCGFAMETENLLENAAGKLRRKNLDLIVANSLRTPRRGLRRRYERRDAPDGNGGRNAAAAFEGRDGGPHFG